MSSAAPLEADVPPIDASTPLFSNQRGRCARCGVGAHVRVHFDGGCAEVVGEHFHRECRFGYGWAEQVREAGR